MIKLYSPYRQKKVQVYDLLFSPFIIFLVFSTEFFSPGMIKRLYMNIKITRNTALYCFTFCCLTLLLYEMQQLRADF